MLRATIQGDLDYGTDWNIKFENLVVETFMMEALDHSIGLLMKTERNIINEAGLNGLFDYGNASTWSQRMMRWMQYHSQPQIGDPDV